MIICKNCGAEYDDEQDRCPYCGGDNFGKSVQVHEDMMNELEREKKRWKEMPEKVAGKGMSWTAKLGIAAVIMVAVICIIVFIVSSISHKVSYRVEQKKTLGSMIMELRLAYLSSNSQVVAPLAVKVLSIMALLGRPSG